ncbi:MAG: PilZ domain-containing protein [Myxococcales bacterium]|nr:PilZ domain-containing protein [Myxococcales bacterium]
MASDLRNDLPGGDPERILVECCAAGTPAVVTLDDGQESLRASFAAFRRRRIELEVMDVPPDAVAGRERCYVSFLYRGRPIHFSAPIHATDRNGGHALVWIEMPEHVSGDASRGAFRIPAGGPIAPTVELVDDTGTPRKATLVNLSLSGILLRFCGEAPPLLPDQSIELSVRVVGEHARLVGVVRRIEGDAAALSFPDAFAEGPENPIRRAVAALERDWHAQLRGRR